MYIVIVATLRIHLRAALGGLAPAAAGVDMSADSIAFSDRRLQ
jgi:hypothetical protein